MEIVAADCGPELGGRREAMLCIRISSSLAPDEVCEGELASVG